MHISSKFFCFRKAFTPAIRLSNSLSFYSCCSTLYNEGHATVPNLAEKLTLELVHHIEVSYYFISTNYLNYLITSSQVFDSCRVSSRKLCPDWRSR